MQLLFVQDCCSLPFSQGLRSFLRIDDEARIRYLGPRPRERSA